MSGPVQQPVTSIAVWDSIRLAESIIDEADCGYFTNAAYLTERIMRDDRVYSAVMTRIHGLLGKKLEFEPANDRSNGTKARNIAEDIETDWPTIFPHATLIRLKM